MVGVACCGMLWHVVACCGMHAHCVALCGISKNVFYLASNGCNRWEMELAEELYMLWMHVDGSP